MKYKKLKDFQIKNNELLFKIIKGFLQKTKQIQNEKH